MVSNLMAKCHLRLGARVTDFYFQIEFQLTNLQSVDHDRYMECYNKSHFKFPLGELVDIYEAKTRTRRLVEVMMRSTRSLASDVAVANFYVGMNT